MAIAGTEAVNSKANGLDLQPPLSVLRMLAEAQVEASKVVLGALEPLARGAEIAADRLASGGRIVYAAAGSSGLMAMADGLELPGTYGITRDRIVILIAGGTNAFYNLPGAPEDSADDAIAELTAQKLSTKDCLIAISASGTTPYAVAALDEGRRIGAATIGMANNAGTPLIDARRGRHLPSDAAGDDRGFHPHGRRHCAKDRAQHDVDHDRHPSRSCA